MRGHRSVMPIHACEAVFEYPADVYLYILVNPCNIQGGFLATTLSGPWTYKLRGSLLDILWNESSFEKYMRDAYHFLNFCLLYTIIEFRIKYI